MGKQGTPVNKEQIIDICSYCSESLGLLYIYTKTLTGLSDTTIKAYAKLYYDDSIDDEGNVLKHTITSTNGTGNVLLTKPMRYGAKKFS